MVGNPRDLGDLLSKDADLVLTCRSCNWSRTIPAKQVISIFHRRGWGTGWQQAQTRFRCRRCQSKDIALGFSFYEAALRRQQARANLRVVEPALRRGLRPPPPGVSLDVWNNASEVERKRLCDRYRS